MKMCPVDIFSWGTLLNPTQTTENNVYTLYENNLLMSLDTQNTTIVTIRISIDNEFVTVYV